MRSATPDTALAALDAVPVEQIGAAIARLAARLLTEPVAHGDDGAALLTPDGVAALLHVSKKYVYGHASELGVIRVGRQMRFKRSTVERRVARRS
jgi:excisionase family DNA binding protein